MGWLDLRTCMMEGRLCRGTVKRRARSAFPRCVTNREHVALGSHRETSQLLCALLWCNYRKNKSSVFDGRLHKETYFGRKDVSRMPYNQQVLKLQSGHADPRGDMIQLDEAPYSQKISKR